MEEWPWPTAVCFAVTLLVLVQATFCSPQDDHGSYCCYAFHDSLFLRFVSPMLFVSVYTFFEIMEATVIMSCSTTTVCLFGFRFWGSQKNDRGSFVLQTITYLNTEIYVFILECWVEFDSLSFLCYLTHMLSVSVAWCMFVDDCYHVH